MSNNTYDPKEREREKQFARDKDAADLASGKITHKELRERNAFIKGDSKIKIDFSKIPSIKRTLSKRIQFQMNMNLTENQMKLLTEEAVYRLNESPRFDDESLFDFLKRVCVARLANRYLKEDILACQSITVGELFNHNILSYDDIINPPDFEEGEEIYEWWLVSDWLANQLEMVGQSILNGFDCKYWGRQCTGQAIILDGVLQKIAMKYVDDEDVHALYREYKSKNPF